MKRRLTPTRFNGPEIDRSWRQFTISRARRAQSALEFTVCALFCPAAILVCTLLCQGCNTMRDTTEVKSGIYPNEIVTTTTHTKIEWDVDALGVACGSVLGLYGAAWTAIASVTVPKAVSGLVLAPAKLADNITTRSQ